MADWYNLHSDMVMLVGRCLKEVRDHLAFAAVCSSWRSVALEIRPTFPRPIPGLMFPGLQSRPFFSLSEKKRYNNEIYLTDDDVCVGSHGGWLFIVHKNLDISLYNPFSRKRVCLPPCLTFPNLGEGGFDLSHNKYYVRLAAFSCKNINMVAEDATVMVVEGGFRRLAFAKPGDTSWRIIEEDDDFDMHYSDVLFYKGKFYAIGQDKTVVCDIGPNPKSTSIATLPPEHPSLFCTKRYLIELMGELLLIERLMDMFNDDLYLPDKKVEAISLDDMHVSFDVDYLDSHPNLDNKNWYKTMLFLVYKMDFATHHWVPIEDLKDHVIFVGYNSAFSMPNWEPKESNCIYFTDDYELAYGQYNRETGFYGYDMGVFEMKTKKIKYYNGNNRTLYPPPMWVTYIPW